MTAEQEKTLVAISLFNWDRTDQVLKIVSELLERDMDRDFGSNNKMRSDLEQLQGFLASSVQIREQMTKLFNL
jgi:hypothetical protein